MNMVSTLRGKAALPARRGKAFMVFLLLILLFPPATLGAEGLSVVTTLFPLKEFAQSVGGKRVTVRLLLPPGAEPHTWEPKPSDIVRLSHADLFIYIGAELEPRAHSIVKSLDNATIQIIAVSRGIPLIRADEVHHHAGHDTKEELAHGEGDPHIWLDFEYSQAIVDRIEDAFSKKDPEWAEYYRKNADDYKEKLKDLDLQYKKTLSNCASREFILGSHAAFAYMARRYGLKQISLYGVSPNSEPTPRKMAEVISMAKDHRVKAIYYEELVSDKLARAIAKEVGAETLVLNPGANLTKAQIESKITFLSLMERNLENLRNGLSCE
jgi:zinc transport system substrate-binding protein